MLYVAFSRMRTIATITLPNRNELFLNLIGDFDDIPKPDGVQDTKSGWGLRVTIRSDQDIRMAAPLINRAYEGKP